MVKVFIDIFSKDEMISDSCPIVISPEFNGAIIEVKSKVILKSGDNDFGIGETPDESEESKEKPEPTGDAKKTEKVIDLVEGFNLKYVSYSKKEYLAYLKTFILSLIKNLTDNGKSSRIPDFKKGASAFVAFINNDFDNFKFYAGESLNAAEGSLAAAYYKPGVSEATFYYFADALIGKEYKIHKQ